MKKNDFIPIAQQAIDTISVGEIFSLNDLQTAFKTIDGRWFYEAVADGTITGVEALGSDGVNGEWRYKKI